MKFAVGDIVVDRSTLRPHTNYCVSEVVAYIGNSVITKMWGDGFGSELHKYEGDCWEFEPGSRNWKSAFSRHLESELCTPAEALVELRKLEAAKDSLEAEFTAVRDQVREKLDKAALLVKEAGDIIKPLDKEFYDMSTECKDLYLALKDGGWSHSTMSCKYGR